MTRSLLLVLVLMSWIRSAFGADPSPITLDSIVKALQAREKALTSFEIHGREYIADNNGNRIEPSVLFEFTYAYASGGRVELRNVVYNPGSDAPFLDWYRDDGQKLYKMRSFDGAGEVVDSVTILPTPNSSSENRVGKNILLHSLTPLGVKLDDLLLSSEGLLIEEDANGDRFVSTTVRKGNGKLGLVLSERHDFLPSSIDFGNGFKITVTEFQLFDGFWFPKKAIQQMKEMGGKPMRMAYVVDSVLVNFPVDRNRFGLPELEPGVHVEDQTTNTHYTHGAPRNDSSASNRLRSAFERKYHKAIADSKGSIPPASLALSHKTLPVDKVADQAPEQSSIARLAMVLCVGSMLAVCYLIIRVKW